MKLAQLVPIGCFAIPVFALVTTSNASFAIDRPIQSSALGLFAAGWILVLLALTFGRLFEVQTRSHEDGFSSSKQLYGSRNPSPTSTKRFKGLRTILQWLFFLFTVAAICWRVEVFRLILRDKQCTSPGIEGFLPILTSIFQLWYIRKGERYDGDKRVSERASGVSVDTLRQTWRNLSPAFLVACAHVLASMASSTLRSTSICPIATGKIAFVPVLQYIGLFLDFFILESLGYLLEASRGDRYMTGRKRLLVVGSIFLLASISLFIAGGVILMAKPEYRPWVFGVTYEYIKDLAWLTITITISIVFSIRLIAKWSATDFTVAASFICTCVNVFIPFRVTSPRFPPGSTTLSMVLLFVGIFSYVYFKNSVGYSSHQPLRGSFLRFPAVLYAVIGVLLFIFQIVVLYTSADMVLVHPIDRLIAQAAKNHDTWLTQAKKSKTLGQAVQEYRHRYDRHPPPSFDKWYDYATARSSYIIDDYDSIFEDLLPFWAFSPQQLRELTRDIISDPWNEIAEVRIRSGKADLGYVLPTHKWMLDGVLSMIKDFQQWLPDMELAFNINDESRVAVPHSELQKYRNIGFNAGRLEVGKDPRWSNDRAQSWPPLELPSPPSSYFKDRSFINSFYDFGSIACPGDSLARRDHIWDPSLYHASFSNIHSDGPFISNWTLSASPCHQPDLAHLHGFYLSPAAFKTSHELLPVFSQSKPHGFADILFPSPWNYMDKVKYEASSTEGVNLDPSFVEKNNTLFWRGATSEGVSNYGTWKGMMRQRLVHYANNLTSAVPVLLPHSSKASTFKYTYVSPSILPKLTNTSLDIAIVDGIARCRGPDCLAQEREFNLVKPMEFQSHWQFRFLMDMDGAAFSGRFLPFLRSRSLPFKAALFREWYDSRLTAWREFVPVDLRLHGLWSLLAYFGNGAEDASDSLVDAQGRAEANASPLEGGLAQAEKIANQGRDWAGKVLRKEDMEIYFFRLLLEWGRLTDDRRDEIGFDM